MKLACSTSRTEITWKSSRIFVSTLVAQLSNPKLTNTKVMSIKFDYLNSLILRKVSFTMLNVCICIKLVGEKLAKH